MEFIILALPVLALIWMVSSIIRFCRTNKENSETRKEIKKHIIISAVLIVAWIAIIGFFLLFIIYSIAVHGM